MIKADSRVLTICGAILLLAGDALMEAPQQKA
jgi:hypothetical protein